jgi:hypothetical protein
MTDQAHRFFFVRMQRTAGTALRQRMVNHFGEAAVYPTTSSSWGAASERDDDGPGT